MNIKAKKVRKINELAESTYVASSRIVTSYAPKFIEKIGIVPHVPLPIFEVVKGLLYWQKATQGNINDSSAKIALNQAFYFSMILASFVALGLEAAGFRAASAIVLVASGYVNASRTFGKAVRSAINQEENYQHKIANNLQKTMVTGLITTGILLISLFPALEYVGVICELVAAGHLFLSSFPILIKNEVSNHEEVVEQISIADEESVDMRDSHSSTSSMLRFSQSSKSQETLFENEIPGPYMRARHSI